VETSYDWAQKFTPEGVFLAKSGHAASGVDYHDMTHDMTVDEDGNIYVADGGNDRVHVFQWVP
jgi:hypothetical protein